MATWTSTLADLRLELEDPSPGIFSDALLLTWWNEGQRDFARRTHSLKDEQYTQTVEAQTSYELPDETIDIHNAIWSRDGEPVQIAPTAYENLVGRDETGDVTHFALYNGAIYLYPTPNVAATLTVLRTYAPDDLTSASTIPFDNYESNTVKSYVKWRAYEMTGDVDTAAWHRDNYEKGVMEREWTQIHYNDAHMMHQPQEVW